MTCSAAARALAPPPGSIQRGQFTCARCGTVLTLCACEGSRYGQDVVMILPNRLPEDATAEQHMDRWANHVVMNPGAGRFDALKFVQDMKAKGIIPAFARLKPQLEAMAEHYCSSSTGISRLLERMRQYNVEEYLREVAEAGACEAVQQFTSFDWSRMDNLGLSLVNNVYQDSDPEESPLTDSDLSLGFEVLGCLVQVNKMASEQLSYSFEPFDWQ